MNIFLIIAWKGGFWKREHEFDGESTGTADGARIRSASIKGTSLFAELGLRMEPTATSPGAWTSASPTTQENTKASAAA